MTPSGLSVLARFLRHVNKNGPVPGHRPELGPCWIWTASTMRGGYGQFRVEPAPAAKRGAHRVAVELLVGPIPKGCEPDHLCRTTACVKAVADEHGPAHLEVVTRRENLLRGETMPAMRARITHCPAGHLYDEENTYRSKRGERHCRRCHRERQAKRRADSDSEYG